VANFGNAVGWYNPAVHVDHAHNLFLNIAAERGIIGLVTFAILVVALFRNLAKGFHLGASPIYRAVSAGLFASFVAFFAHSLFDVSYYDYKILLLFWLLLGIAASLPFLFEERGTSPLSPSPRSALSTNVPVA
jgi:O-antigen ligase